MSTLLLFTDGSADILSGTGYGAYLAVPENTIPHEGLKNQVKVRRFENTSSSRLELETLNWALSCICSEDARIVIYTDSQNIIRLTDRRKRLEQGNYYSKNNRLIINHDLYKEFFQITDKLNFELVKIKGHLPSKDKNSTNRFFSYVDKASRKALRKELREEP